MTRPGPYLEIYNLPIGGEATARPKNGEPVDKALRRIKTRLFKYAAEGRYYRARLDGDVVRVQRTREGQNTKIADWLMMKPGHRLLLKSKPTSADVKKARDQCAYVTSIRRWNKVKHLPIGERLPAARNLYGSWLVILDRQGRLVVECWCDVDGNWIDDSLGDAAPLKTLWEGEWP